VDTVLPFTPGQTSDSLAGCPVLVGVGSRVPQVLCSFLYTLLPHDDHVGTPGTEKETDAHLDCM
jgi:hypothetical protein